MDLMISSQSYLVVYFLTQNWIRLWPYLFRARLLDYLGKKLSPHLRCTKFISSQKAPMHRTSPITVGLINYIYTFISGWPFATINENYIIVQNEDDFSSKICYVYGSFSSSTFRQLNARLLDSLFDINGCTLFIERY